MTGTRVKVRPEGLMLAFAYLVAVPVWLLSVPLIFVAEMLE